MRIIIIDDHELLRSGLIAVTSFEDDIEVVGEGSSGLEAIELYEKTHPDIVVMDVTMPEMGGLEASSIILERHPDAKILIMTQHEERSFIDAVLSINVSGCIGKRAVGSEFISALRSVERGEFFLHSSIARMVVRTSKRNSMEPGDSLTPREREVLAQIVDGKTNAQIAKELYLSVKTVEWHRSNLMNKLGVHGVAELVSYALTHQLLSGGEKDDTAIDRLP